MIFFQHLTILVICSIVWACYGQTETANSSSCGDWTSFKDEKCYKLLDDTLRTFDEAQKTCVKLDDSPSLTIIRSKEEQDFLVEYVFKTLKKVENVWIGARFFNNKFHWIDNTDLSYTNWVAKGTKNKTNFCVQMEAEEDSVGKWIDEPCEQKKLVVCQKMQLWPISRLQNALLDARKEFRDSLEAANKKFDESNAKLNEYKQNSVPIGFIYAQLPNEKSPAEIWPLMNWTDVSTAYAGVFFRVNGGEAATFGQVQEENAPRLSQVRTGNAANIKQSTRPWDIETPIPKTGWSNGIPTGAGCCDNVDYITFEHSSGEIRPRNMAIRAWKRTS